MLADDLNFTSTPQLVTSANAASNTVTNLAANTATNTATKAAIKVAIARDWWSKTFAGVVLGFALSLALVGLFAWLGPGGIHADEKNQFVMWMITPIWMLILSFIYLCRSGTRAILYLLIANCIAHTILFLVRH